MHKKKLAVLTGAGISAESGLATFRDSGGLWEGFDVNEVATPEAWKLNPKKVLDFYNLRLTQALSAQPNRAHKGLVELEAYFDVQVITQNVDDLHERAGSKNVLHLHGELRKARSELNENIIVDIGSSPINIGDLAEDEAQLRPHIVWFGEMVPMLEKAAVIIDNADILVVIGSSLVVYPAAGLVHYAKPNIPKDIIDPSLPELTSYKGWVHIKECGTKGVEQLIKKLKEDYE